jgi:hypothetical protein
MTAKRDLKKRVRDRQQRTGESYTTAREHVLAGRDPGDERDPGRTPVEVLELVDLSAEAARLGLVCRAAMAPALVERVDGATVLARLRTALLAAEGDPGTALLRRVLLRGEDDLAPILRLASDALERARDFMARARAGIAGPSESGRMLALHVDGKLRAETIVFVLCPQPPRVAGLRPPLLLVWPPEPLLRIEDFNVWAAP